MGDAHRPVLRLLLLTLSFLLIILSLASLSSASRSFTCLRGLFTIKSLFCGHLYEAWSSSVRRHARLRNLHLYAPAMTSHNLLLLANFVVFITLMSMSLRSAAAARSLKTRKKKKLFEQNRSEEDAGDGSRYGQVYQFGSAPPLIIDTSGGHGKEAEENWAATTTASTSFVKAQIIEEASTMTESSCSEYEILRPAITEQAVLADEAIMLQDEGGSSFPEQRKGSELADLTGRLPCHNHLQAAPRRMSCDHSLSCFTTDSNSFCTHHPKKLKSHVHVGRHSISTSQSKQVNSNPEPVSVTTSITFHAQRSAAMDPDCKETLLASKSRVKSMGATNEPTNLDGGQKLNCRTGKRSSIVRERPCRLRREPSITSQDELKTRVESFISKFNQNIKIQRQQSLMSFLQMVNRGS